MGLALVTGATGIVGRYIADALLAQGDRVRIVTRRSPKPWHANLEIVQGAHDDAIIMVKKSAFNMVNRSYSLINRPPYLPSQPRAPSPP